MTIQYQFPIKLSGNGPVVYTNILSPRCDALVYVLFITTRDFDLERAQPSHNCSVPVNLTLKALYVVHNKFYPICEYLCTTFMYILLDIPNFLRHSYFSSPFPDFIFLHIGKCLLSLWVISLCLQVKHHTLVLNFICV